MRSVHCLHASLNASGPQTAMMSLWRVCCQRKDLFLNTCASLALSIDIQLNQSHYFVTADLFSLDLRLLQSVALWQNTVLPCGFSLSVSFPFYALLHKRIELHETHDTWQHEQNLQQPWKSSFHFLHWPWWLQHCLLGKVYSHKLSSLCTRKKDILNILDCRGKQTSSSSSSKKQTSSHKGKHTNTSHGQSGMRGERAPQDTTASGTMARNNQGDSNAQTDQSPFHLYHPLQYGSYSHAYEVYQNYLDSPSSSNGQLVTSTPAPAKDDRPTLKGPNSEQTWGSYVA